MSLNGYILDEDNISMAEKVALLTKEDRDQVFAGLTESQIRDLQYDWKFWGRPKQQIPVGNWFIWLILAGRGFGKTRTGAETIRLWQEQGYSSIALIGKTNADIRDVMIYGESGILATAPPWNRPEHIVSKRCLVWPNGAKAFLYSDEDPEQLRGPQHHKAWIDELCKFKNAQDTWDNMEMGLRLGTQPQVIVTTTPKPTKQIKALLRDPKAVITTGSSYENKNNLSEVFIERIIARYEGTRLGAQELHANVLEDVSGALWDREMIDKDRLLEVPLYVRLIRIVVAIDPSVSSSEEADECGIVVAAKGDNEQCYVLADRSLRANPEEWISETIFAYRQFKADRIIGEVNQGGDLVETLLRMKDKNVSYKKVIATKGKQLRAEPVSALYEQGKVSHIGVHEQLEIEMTEWVPGEGKSPNRVDALVYAITELMLEETNDVVVTRLRW